MSLVTSTRRRRRSIGYVRIVNALRILWALRVIWAELGLFRWHVSFCAWPDAYLHKRSQDNVCGPLLTMMLS